MKQLKAAVQNMELLCAQHIPHSVELGNNTIYINSEFGGRKTRNSFTDNKLKNKDLNFIKRVRKHISESVKNLEIPKTTARDVAYIGFNRHIAGRYENVTEIDVNGAYWQTAYLMGFIGDEIYREGLTVDKMTRLIALGSLAGERTLYRFETKTRARITNGFPDLRKLAGYKYEGVISDERLRSLFFLICQEMGNLMSDCVDRLGGNAFKIFWVDALIIDKDYRHGVINFFRSKGYECKEKEAEYLLVFDEGQHKEAYLKMMGGPHKLFTLSNNCGVKMEAEQMLRELGYIS